MNIRYSFLDSHTILLHTPHQSEIIALIIPENIYKVKNNYVIFSPNENFSKCKSNKK